MRARESCRAIAHGADLSVQAGRGEGVRLICFCFIIILSLLKINFPIALTVCFAYNYISALNGWLYISIRFLRNIIHCITTMQIKSLNNVVFFHDYRSLPFPRKLLNKIADKIYKNEKIIRNKSVNVVLCSDYTIRKLNKNYRKIDRTTDVLSFPFKENNLLGEIYISTQRAAVQARRYNLTYAQEVGRLFIHGMFHLLGYDHETNKERKLMESHEGRYY